MICAGCLKKIKPIDDWSGCGGKDWHSRCFDNREEGWIGGYNYCMKEKIKQIKSELRFLNCQGIKYLVHEADIRACHMDSSTIENRKMKLKKELKRIRNSPKTSKEKNRKVDGVRT